MQMQTSKPRRTLDEIMSERWRCLECSWEGEWRDRIHSRLRGYICPHCHNTRFERVEDKDKGASAK